MGRIVLGTPVERRHAGRLPNRNRHVAVHDVDGSTRLLHQLGPDAYAGVLKEHRRLLREAYVAHDGVEVDTQGDAFFFAFPSAQGALDAAADGGGALEVGPIRVRIGIHTGTPTLTDEGHVGRDVHMGEREILLLSTTST